MFLISAISFLNAAPLAEPLRAQLPPGCEMRWALPSQCAEHLRAGAADLALIPVAAYATMPDAVIVPGMSIAAKGAVRSIIVVSKVPFEQIKSLAADQASRSSVALCRVLFRKFYGGPRKVTAMRPDLQLMLQHHDAALIIGDPALRLEPPEGLHVYDLAEEWHRHTGLPFVFAIWAVREHAIAEFKNLGFAARLAEARDKGVELIPQIAQEWAPRLKLEPQFLQDYLRNLHFRLDEEHIAGMKLFLEYAAECGLLPSTAPLRFIEQPARAHPATT